jgi:hypothetical protein
MRKFMLAAASAILATSPALAVPILSGSYATSGLLLCQIEAKVDSSTGQLTVANRGIGQMAIESFIIDFDTAAGTATNNGVAIDMSAILEKFTDGTHRGYAPKRYPIVNSGSYSNTDTTITFNAVTFDVVYGHINGKGVADSFTGIRKEGKHCALQVQAERR